MKTPYFKRVIALLAGILCLVIAVLFILSYPKKEDSATEHGNFMPTQPAQSNTNVPAASSARELPDQTPASRAEGFAKALAAMNLPISFYGRVVDQNETPVNGVQVVFRIRQPRFDPEFIAGADFSQSQATTDAYGTFGISGTSGDVLVFESIQKEGYVLTSSFKKEYNYVGATPFSPDPRNPVIIRMWRLTEPQLLQHHRLSRIGIPCDGQEVSFDLILGAKVTRGGQLQVQFWRNPEVLSNSRTTYYWKLILSMTNGGLIPASGDFLFTAPAEGYQQSWEIEMPASQTNWISKMEQAFYVKLNDGPQFGRVFLTLSTHYNPPPVGLTLDVVLNPTGSRNLEPK